jgi:hypothetical protein
MITARHLGLIWRLGFERRRAVKYRVGIDAGDRGYVLRLRGADEESGHQDST